MKELIIYGIFALIGICYLVNKLFTIEKELSDLQSEIKKMK